MHYIIYPQDIVVVDIKTKEPMLDTNGKEKKAKLFDLTVDVAFNDKTKFGDGWKAGVAVKAIYDKLSSAKPGDVIELEEDHYERLNSSLLVLTAGTDKDSGIRYDPKILMQILPILRAVKDAMSEDEYKEWKKKQDPVPEAVGSS